MAAATALAPLAQPLLADDIAPVITPSWGQQVAGVVADYLLRAKAITRRDFPLAASDPLQACSLVLTNWLHRHVGETACLEPLFQLEPSPFEKTEEFDEAVAALDGTDAHKVRGIHIHWSERDVCQWIVGPGLDRLEAAVPGLGATALTVLEEKSRQCYPLFTPSVVLDEASNLYWMGEADETEYLESACGDDPEALETMRAEMVTRAAIEQAFPQWALQNTSAALSQSALHELSISHPDGFARRAAELARGLRDTPPAGHFSAMRDGLFTGFGAVLCWQDNDIAVRVSDDYAQYAWQGDYFDEIGEAIVPLSDPRAFRTWMRAIRPNLRTIGLIDQLLHHLVEGY